MTLIERLCFCCCLLAGGAVLCVSESDEKQRTPVVIWHGIGDSVEGAPRSMRKLIHESLGDDVYVKRIQIGATLLDDYYNSILMHPNIQVSKVCKQIRDDPKLANGYHAVGLSQGGIFMRAVVQRCPEPRIKNLITLGAPHQGVYGLPRCLSMQTGVCEIAQKLLYLAAYRESTQDYLVPATYWHDPFNEDIYRTHSTFLSDINNERRKNEKYSRNLRKLDKFVMVKFEKDTVTQPRETHWFEFYVPGQDKEILPLRQSRLYSEDKIGLAEMEKKGKLVFLKLDTEHLIYSNQWFKENVIQYLKT